MLGAHLTSLGLLMPNLKRKSILNIVLPLLRRQEILKRRANHARRDTIDPDIGVRQLPCQRSCKLRQGSFGKLYAIAPTQPRCPAADPTRMIPLSLPHHVRNGRLGESESGMDVHVKASRQRSFVISKNPPDTAVPAA